MSPSDSILILSSCTAKKTSAAADRPVIAEELYEGEQHRRLMRGVAGYRKAGQQAGELELKILSAGHGVLAADTPVRAYDETFAGMRRTDLHRRADALGIPESISRLLAPRRRLAVVLLGQDYLQAARIGSLHSLGAPTLVFTSPKGMGILPSIPGLHAISLDNSDAKRFSCPLVALKGALAERLLSRLALDPHAAVPLSQPGLLPWLELATTPKGVRTLDQDLARAA